MKIWLIFAAIHTTFKAATYSGPVVLIAQLVEHCTGIAVVTGSNPVQAWIFFRLGFWCLSCVNNCDDQSYLHIFRAIGISCWFGMIFCKDLAVFDREAHWNYTTCTKFLLFILYPTSYDFNSGSFSLIYEEQWPYLVCLYYRNLQIWLKYHVTKLQFLW